MELIDQIKEQRNAYLSQRNTLEKRVEQLHADLTEAKRLLREALDCLDNASVHESARNQIRQFLAASGGENDTTSAKGE